jgi:alpha-glucuronidase
MIKKILLLLLLFTSMLKATAESGYECWLRYSPVESKYLAPYLNRVAELQVNGNSSTIMVAKDEFLRAMNGMLGKNIKAVSRTTKNGTIIIGNKTQIGIAGAYFDKELATTGNEGYIIVSKLING